MICTIGHSTRKIGDFLAMLNSFGVKTLADVRAIPASRFNPQYNARALEKSLLEQAVEYVPMKELGGRRHARADSPNAGLSEGFRGFADYMQTDEFEKALDRLIAFSKAQPACIMCAEKLPSACHRSLIADALTVRGIEVTHILAEGESVPHRLNWRAQVSDGRIVYLPEAPELELFAKKA